MEEEYIKRIKKRAEEEYKEECFRKEVEKYKDKLRKRISFWDKIFPFKILVIKKER